MKSSVSSDPSRLAGGGETRRPPGGHEPARKRACELVEDAGVRQDTAAKKEVGSLVFGTKKCSVTEFFNAHKPITLIRPAAHDSVPGRPRLGRLIVCWKCLSRQPLLLLGVPLLHLHGLLLVLSLHVLNLRATSLLLRHALVLLLLLVI